MAKIPYLIRRKNVFYFRLGVPVELRETIKSREIIQSLRTENSQEAALKALILAAHFKTLLHDLQNGEQCDISRFDSLALLSAGDNEQAALKPLQSVTTSTHSQEAPQSPLLSVVIDDFLKRTTRTTKPPSRSFWLTCPY